MSAAAPRPPEPALPLDAAPVPEEQRMLLYCSWKEYAVLRELLDGPSPKLTYLEGRLEITSPAGKHEIWKKNIARFVEHYAFVRDVDLRGYGSTTFKVDVKERGAEPDECYLLGKKLADFPEIVLEVVYTAPLLNKLEVYLGFGVPEVWVFRNEKLTIHVLDRARGAYDVKPRSDLLPELDFELLARYALREDTSAALKEFDALLRDA